MISIDDVRAAAARIEPFARKTPVVCSTTLDRLVEAEVFCKAESLQRTGSFKFRGATNAVAAMSNNPSGIPAGGVVTFSSGNHGQAISRAAALHGVRATVVMPTDAPTVKRHATEHWGAAIVEYDRYSEDRDEVAARVLADTDGVLIPPYDHVDVMAGQGTTALELFEQVAGLDMLVVCVGGGGLLAGCATVAKELNPHIRIVGVEPHASDDHVRSHAAGKRVELESMPRTIADGQQLVTPGELTWQVTSQLTDEFVSVSDNEIVETMRLLFAHHKLVVEPSGASALAAVLHHDLVDPGMRVGVTLSGGNIDPARFFELLDL